MQGRANGPWIPAFAGMTESRVAEGRSTIERSDRSAHPTYNPRHPREGGDPGGLAGPCRRPWIPACAGRTKTFDNRHPGESRDPGGLAGPCRRPWIPACASRTKTFDNRHPGVSRDPGEHARSCQSALDSGFRRNDGIAHDGGRSTIERSDRSARPTYNPRHPREGGGGLSVSSSLREKDANRPGGRRNPKAGGRAVRRATVRRGFRSVAYAG